MDCLTEKSNSTLIFLILYADKEGGSFSMKVYDQSPPFKVYAEAIIGLLFNFDLFNTG